LTDDRHLENRYILIFQCDFDKILYFLADLEYINKTRIIKSKILLSDMTNSYGSVEGPHGK